MFAEKGATVGTLSAQKLWNDYEKSPQSFDCGLFWLVLSSSY